MKKRFVLVLALILMVSATLFAADEKKAPAVKFSGWGKFGYKFTFADDNGSAAEWKSPEGRLNFHITDGEGMWDLTFKNLTKFSGDYGITVGAYVSLSKAMKQYMDIDTKDFSFGYGIGASTSNDVLSVYSDASGNDYDDVYASNGGQVMYFDGAYAKIAKFKLAFSPVYTTASASGDKTSSATIGASATFAPVEGVGVGVGYVNKGGFDYMDGLTYKSTGASFKFVYDNLLNATVNVDIAKLADLKFKLALSANEIFGNKGQEVFYAAGKATGATADNDDNYNFASCELAGGVDACDAFAEFGMLSSNKDDFDNVYYLYVQANLNMVKNLPIDIYFENPNMAADDFTCKVGADIGYKMGSAAYNLNAEYQNKYYSGLTNSDGDKVGSFAITPSVKISF